MKLIVNGQETEPVKKFKLSTVMTPQEVEEMLRKIKKEKQNEQSSADQG